MLVELTERARGPSETADGKRYVKYFVTTPARAETDAPAIGALMSGASGVMGARVSTIDSRPDPKNSRVILAITYEELTAYSGGDATELAKSRYLDDQAAENVYVRRWAWNGTDAMPEARGGLYPGYSGLNAPVCVSVSTQRQWNAGRHLVTAKYSAMVSR